MPLWFFYLTLCFPQPCRCIPSSVTGIPGSAVHCRAAPDDCRRCRTGSGWTFLPRTGCTGFLPATTAAGHMDLSSRSILPGDTAVCTVLPRTGRQRHAVDAAAFAKTCLCLRLPFACGCVAHTRATATFTAACADSAATAYLAARLARGRGSLRFTRRTIAADIPGHGHILPVHHGPFDAAHRAVYRYQRCIPDNACTTA